MWTMIVSLGPLVEVLSPVFTQPSFATNGQFLLGWLMNLGQRSQLARGRGRRLLAGDRHPHPGVAAVGAAARAGPGSTQLSGVGPGDARRGAGLVAAATLYPGRGRRLCRQGVVGRPRSAG